MSPRKPDPELLKLQQEWDQKLKDAGFVDQEDRRTGFLKTRSGSSPTCYRAQMSKTSSAQSKLDQEEYYRRAGHFLYDHAFSSTIDQAVWEGHAEGKPHASIAETLGIPAARVKRAVWRLRAIMLGRPAPKWLSGHKVAQRPPGASRSDQGKK